MTKRKDPSELKIAARDDLTVKPRKKRGADATPEAKAARIAKLRATGTNNSMMADVETMNPERPLTEKQRRFVGLWASGETILTASHLAGYNDGGSIAYRMARDPAVLKIYNFEKAKYEEASQMTRKRVMDGLLEGIEMAKMLSEPASVISGWREVGKMCGYYEPVKRQIDINVSGSVTLKQLERMSDADLLQLVKGEVEDVTFKEIEDGDDDGEGDDN